MEGLQEGVEVASISKVEEATLTKHYFYKISRYGSGLVLRRGANSMALGMNTHIIKLGASQRGFASSSRLATPKWQ